MAFLIVIYDDYNKEIKYQSQIRETEYDACKDIVKSNAFSHIQDQKVTKKLLQRFLENYHSYMKQQLHCILYRFNEVPIVDSPKRFISIYLSATKIVLCQSELYETEHEACLDLVNKLIKKETSIPFKTLDILSEMLGNVKPHVKMWDENILRYYLKDYMTTHIKPFNITDFHIILHEIIPEIPVATIVKSDEKDVVGNGDEDNNRCKCWIL